MMEFQRSNAVVEVRWKESIERGELKVVEKAVNLGFKGFGGRNLFCRSSPKVSFVCSSMKDKNIKFCGEIRA